MVEQLKNLNDIYSKEDYIENMFFTQRRPIISYEVFPPKNDQNGDKLNNLIQELTVLKKYNPSLVSVTYGAGGSNREQSVDIIQRIKDELKLNPMPHFTCVSCSEKDIKDYLTNIERLGIKNILALRGDIPDGEFCRDFLHASELVEFIKDGHDLSVAVAGYPETHNESCSFEDDIKWLKYKVDKGADVIYTQLFFDNNKYFGFVEVCADEGINVPIIPGILPVTNYNQLLKMTSLCKVTIPKVFIDKLEKHKDDRDYTRKLGIDFASYQCRQLIDAGVKGLHFYTLNKSDAVCEILENIL